MQILLASATGAPPLLCQLKLPAHPRCRTGFLSLSFWPTHCSSIGFFPPLTDLALASTVPLNLPHLKRSTTLLHSESPSDALAPMSPLRLTGIPKIHTRIPKHTGALRYLNGLCFRVEFFFKNTSLPLDKPQVPVTRLLKLE